MKKADLFPNVVDKAGTLVEVEPWRATFSQDCSCAGRQNHTHRAVPQF